MSSIHSGKHTPTFAPPSDTKKTEIQSKNASVETKGGVKTPQADDFAAHSDTQKPASPAPALTSPRPASPTKQNVQDNGEASLYRSSSARNAPRPASPAPESLRSVKSEPASAVKTKAPGPREFQEHFYELGGVVVDPRYHADAAALAKVIDRKEGLKNLHARIAER